MHHQRYLYFWFIWMFEAVVLVPNSITKTMRISFQGHTLNHPIYNWCHSLENKVWGRPDLLSKVNLSFSATVHQFILCTDFDGLWTFCESLLSRDSFTAESKKTTPFSQKKNMQNGNEQTIKVSCMVAEKEAFTFGTLGLATELLTRLQSLTMFYSFQLTAYHLFYCCSTRRQNVC